MTNLTKVEMYQIAKTFMIPQRSKMTKFMLETAIADHLEEIHPDARENCLLADTVADFWQRILDAPMMGENANDSDDLVDVAVQSVTDYAICRRRLPEVTAGPVSPMRLDTPVSPDGKVVTVATLLAVVNRPDGVACLDRFPATGAIEKLSNSGSFDRSYSPHGRTVEPSYPLGKDATPLVYDALVSASDLLAGGYTFGMSETRFRQSSDAAIRRLAKSGVIPPMWHGEATTVGSIGTNRMASIREMLTDALAPHGHGDYCIEDKTVTLENIQAAMCDMELVVVGKSPKARLGAAYKAAQKRTAEQLASGEISNEIRHMSFDTPTGTAWVEYPVDTLVLEREAVIHDRALINDTLDRNDLDFMDFRGWMAAWDKTDYEQAREAMKSFRMVVVNKQRDYFTRILDHILGGKVSKVSAAFRFPNGTFHTDMKNAKDSDGESLLSSDQRVILDAAAAVKVGRKVSDKQAAIYSAAILSATWEAWMAGLGSATDFDPTDPDAPADDNPWDNNGTQVKEVTKVTQPKGAVVVKPLRRQATERNAADVAMATLPKGSAMWLAISQAVGDGLTDVIAWLVNGLDRDRNTQCNAHVKARIEHMETMTAIGAPISTAPPSDAVDNVPTFTVGEVVLHPAFGTGRVLATKEGKVKVKFSDGERKLSADPTFWQ